MTTIGHAPVLSGHAKSMSVRDLLVARVPSEAVWAERLTSRIDAELGDAPALDVAAGWLRLGGEGAPLCDVLFAISAERLVFLPSNGELAVSGITLAEIAGLDLLEGLDLPMCPIEVRMHGDMAMLVGWPESFCDSIVAVLSGRPPEIAPLDDQPVEDVSSLDQLGPASFVEPVIDVVSPGVDVVSPGVDVVSPAADVVSLSAEPLAPLFGLGLPVAGESGTAEVDSAGSVDSAEWYAVADEGADSASDEVDPIAAFLGAEGDATASESWPAPYREVLYLGGADDQPKRRKNLTLVLDPTGLAAVASGFGSWSLDVSVTEIDGIEVLGVDELLFTHSHRIASSSAAVVIRRRDGDPLVFEVPNSPALALRIELARPISAWNDGPSTVATF